MAVNLPPGFEIGPDGNIRPIQQPLPGTPSPIDTAAPEPGPADFGIGRGGPLATVPPSGPLATVPPSGGGGSGFFDGGGGGGGGGGQLSLPAPAGTTSGGWPGALGALGTGGLWGLGGYLMGKTIEPQPLNVGEDAAIEKALRGRPGREVTPPQTYPHMPWPDTGVARPSAAPPAPKNINLGRGAPGPNQKAAPQVQTPFTLIDRPNMSPQNSLQGRQGAPQMSALDLSRFFQHPAVQAAAAQQQANPNNPYWGPDSTGRAAWGGPLMPHDITGYPVAGVNVPMSASGFTVNPDLKARRNRVGSSSSSEGGNF